MTIEQINNILLILIILVNLGLMVYLSYKLKQLREALDREQQHVEYLEDFKNLLLEESNEKSKQLEQYSKGEK